jgi:hypothetical protein
MVLVPGRRVAYTLCTLPDDLGDDEAYEVRVTAAGPVAGVRLAVDRVGAGLAPPALPVSARTLAGARWAAAAAAASDGPSSSVAVLLSPHNVFYRPGTYWAAATLGDGGSTAAEGNVTWTVRVVADPTALSARGLVWARVLGALVTSFVLIAVFWRMSARHAARGAARSPEPPKDPPLSGPPPPLLCCHVPVPPPGGDVLSPLPPARLTSVSDPAAVFPVRTVCASSGRGPIA